MTKIQYENLTIRHTVNFKTEKISYKVKSSVENPEEKQVVFEDTHEPIIDLATCFREH